MRLSDAIRLGAMLRPQGFGRYFDVAGRSCALGAALDAAVGLGPERETYPDEWMWVIEPRIIRCPACPALSGAIGSAITHLNDHHRWTREAIADWVEPLEPAVPDTMSVVAEVSA